MWNSALSDKIVTYGVGDSVQKPGITDTDTGDSFTYSLLVGGLEAPYYIFLTTNYIIIHTSAPIGVYVIEVTVTDNNSVGDPAGTKSDTLSFIVTVVAAVINATPAWSSQISDQEVFFGVGLSIVIPTY